MNTRLLQACTLAALGTLGGCASYPLPSADVPPSAPVVTVATEHSEALACLGRMIDRSRAPALTVRVTEIRDRTVPTRFESRRLSSGASWWLHTAIGKLGTARVSSVMGDAGKPLPGGRTLVISGAWTQDDLAVGRIAGEIGGVLSKLGLELGASRSHDVIAGDFVSSRNGRVLHATAISVSVRSDRSGLDLRIDDGQRELAVGFSGSRQEGPQFAQRRITEAAALVHVARAYGLDYRRCLPGEQASGGAARRAGA